MTRNHALLVAAEDLACAISGHLAVRAEAPPARMHDIGAQGGFARDFATADGERVMVAALTRQQFVDLARTARLGRTFAFLERLLPADFSTCGDLYTHRATIAALEHIFDVPKELAASCGIMLWLTTFVAVIPAGLLLAHHERLSLRKLSQESQQDELSAATPPGPSMV